MEIAGYWGIYRAGLLRGYETSIIGAVRDVFMFLPLAMLIVWLSRVKRYSGNWILFTTAILLFAVGMLIQYRLYSDPEYNARNKAAARQEKMEALRTRYIIENYDATKKQLMGLPPTPAQAIDVDQLPKRPSTYSIGDATNFELHLDSDFLLYCLCVAFYSVCAMASCCGFNETVF